ncbi:MAG TPA: hypothetical protein VG846_12220, partial [Actinomycetota bacterium]|nr:hypothetical protein [Actinomycetota bacterium]
MALGPRRPRDAHTPACPCGHGDVPAELAGQRPLLERAATGDRQAFALLYDTQVDGVYRYLLAWTGDPGTAAGLTTQVFHSAIGWLPTTPGPEGEAGAWLTAMSRDALAQRGGGPGSLEPAGDVVAAVGRLREPEREVAILRLLLGHSLDHTAHLSGYSRRAAMELQLAACLTLHERTGGTPDGEPTGRTRAAGAVADGDPPEAVAASPPPGTGPVRSAEEFERRLGLQEVDLTGSHPVLAEALAVASSLRRAAPGLVAAPPGDFVRRLRKGLLTGAPTAAAASPAGIGTGAAGIGTGAVGIGAGAATPGPVDSREHHPLGSV